MADSDIKLIAIFSIIVASIVLRVSVEQTGYCSPDSVFYLEVAQNIIDGRGPYHSNVYPLPTIKTSENQTYLAVWPIGYPLFIAVAGIIFSIPVFTASKVVNILFLGLCFLQFRNLNQEKGYILALLFCSFTFLEVFSYTWSEGPFLFFILWFVNSLFNYLQNQNKSIYIFYLFFSSLFLFLTRYIGGFSLIVLSILFCLFIFKKEYKPAVHLLTIIYIHSCLLGLYLLINYFQTGYITGGERIYLDRESLGLYSWYLFVGLFNELFIIKNYYWRGEPITHFFVTALIQFSFLGKIYFSYLKGKVYISTRDLSLELLYTIVGVIYLILLILVRLVSPFDEFDYRLLAPFTLCMYTAILLLIIKLEQSKNIEGIYQYIILLFAFSLLLNLPKAYLISYFEKLLD